MEDRNELRYLGITIGIIVVLGVLTAWLGYDIRRLAVTIQEERQEHAERVAAVSAFTTLKSQAVVAKSFTSTLENILPLKDNLIQFPNEMMEFGKRASVAVSTKFGTETPSTAQSPGSVEFTMTASGTLSAIIEFMGNVERGRYIVAWTTVDIVSENDRGKYRAAINGRVFSR